ncbi:MFS general substrate transporter [Aureobasidium pullulans]|uniref:MFS general substrate transporter n=1 Tax=Aureobasidium pullulans TaxID=5580 RepID=A0A4S9VJQ3_AURPU|nr:MFS general substrate transporter [Aureobasidium pullulans]
MTSIAVKTNGKDSVSQAEEARKGDNLDAKTDLEARAADADPACSSDDTTPFSIYTKGQKLCIILLVSFAATFSGFASNIYFPSIPTIASDLSSSIELINLTVTGYLIFQGLSPTLWGAVSDTYGRRITYICTFVIFIAACIGLAETDNYAQLLVLRCLQSTGSASTIAIGAGVVGDVTTREERGGYMGYFQAGLLLPVAFGPLIGGALASSLGWRAIFWFLAIYAITFLVVLVAFLPETLRSLVSNGSVMPPKYAVSLVSVFLRKRGVKPADGSMTSRKSINVLGSIVILVERRAITSIIFVGVYYMVWQMLVTALSSIFQETYNMSDLQVGLVYLANGVGCILGTLTTGKLLDADYRRWKKRFAQSHMGFPIERVRLRMILFYGPVQCVAVLVFGWVVDKEIHVSVSIICLFFVGWAATSIQSIVSTFLVDLYPDRSASATAALNIVRCLLGAGGTAAVSPCVRAIGVGWTFTIFAGIMVLGGALMGLHFAYGFERTKSAT